MQILPFLQRSSWAEHFKRLAGPTVVALLLVSLVREPSLRSLLKQLVVACFMGAFAAKEMADFPALWERAVTAYRSKRQPLHLLSALIAPEPAGWLRTLAHLLLGFVAWATGRRPAGEDREGLQIPYLKRSGYGALVPLAVLALLVDVPVSVLLLPALGVPESLQFGIRSAVFLAGILTLAGLLGDRWHIASGNHSLSNDKLVLSVGLRLQATIPLCAIQHAQLVGRTDRVCARWSRREIVASPFDRPNIQLLLTEGHSVEVTAWGCAFNGARCIYLYVDEPKVLLAKLRGDA